MSRSQEIVLEGYYVSMMRGDQTTLCFAPDRDFIGNVSKNEFQLGKCYESILYSKYQYQNIYGYGFEETEDGLKVMIVDSFSSAPPKKIDEYLYYKGFLIEMSIAKSYANESTGGLIPNDAERFNARSGDEIDNIIFKVNGTYTWRNGNVVEKGTYQRDGDVLILDNMGEKRPLLIYNQHLVDQKVFCTQEKYASIYYK